jgi:hypothetical protein
MRAEHRPRVRRLRLRCDLFFVDAQLIELDGKWLAAVETVGGPSLGWGRSRDAALVMALEPFDGMIDELLASVPWWYP